MNTYSTNDPRQRSLPTGYADELSVWFIPRPLRTYYQCVTITDDLRHPLALHAATLNAAMDWLTADMNARGGYVPE